MIKIICVNNNMVETSLTFNKVYEVDYESYHLHPKCYYLCNDYGNMTWYHKSNFMPLSELREQQIKTVLDD